MKFRRPKKDDKIRLIYFSPDQSDIRQIEFSIRGLLLTIFSIPLILGGLYFLSVTICNRLYQDKTKLTFFNSRSILKDTLNHVKNNINKFVENIEPGDNGPETEDLEVFLELSSTDSELEFLRNDNTKNQKLMLASFNEDLDVDMQDISEYMSMLQYKLEKAKELQGEIEDKYLQRVDKIKHIPSIRPVNGARITDKFGIRRDPFIKKIKHHNGVDLSARYGTKVYAPADGVVEFTRVRYRKDQGFGRVIILNHGNGYKTLFGHLSRIFVKVGQKVKRWDVIGLSGNTGRATGPHLHYEVWRYGRPQNPEDFMLN